MEVYVASTVGAGVVGSYAELVDASGWASVFHGAEWVDSFASAAPFPVVPRHFFAADSGRLAGALPSFLVRDCPRLASYLSGKVATPAPFANSMLVSQALESYHGGPVLAGDDLSPVGDLCSAMEQEAAQSGVEVFGMVNVSAGRQDLLEHLHDLGFLVANMSPMSSLEVRWKHYDEYVGEMLRRRSGRRMRKIMSVARRAGLCAEITIGGLGSHEFGPVRATLARHGHGGDARGDLGWYAELLAAMGDRVRLVVVRAPDGAPVVTVVLLCHRDTLTGWLGGVDQRRSMGSVAYHFAFQEIIRYAIEAGVARIDFGRGSGEFKRRHGYVATHAFLALKMVDRNREGRLRDWLMDVSQGCVDRFNANSAARHWIQPYRYWES